MEFTVNDVLNNPTALELHDHIQKETNGLIGSQWIIMEFIFLDGKLRNEAPKFVGKILTDENGKTISSPIDYLRTRHYCGIVYHMESWIKKQKTIDSVKSIAQKTGHIYAFYNPYQHKAILVS